MQKQQRIKSVLKFRGVHALIPIIRKNDREKCDDIRKMAVYEYYCCRVSFVCLLLPLTEVHKVPSMKYQPEYQNHL